MIFDTIENISLYRGLSANLAVAIDFIQKTDLNQLENGKHSIQGDNILVIMSEYTTKNVVNSPIEAHKKYIDIQVMLEGKEVFGFAALKNQEEVEAYNAEKDYTFYKAEVQYCNFGTGTFAIFFPTDLHSPGINSESETKVRKAVFKVRVQ